MFIERSQQVSVEKLDKYSSKVSHPVFDSETKPSTNNHQIEAEILKLQQEFFGLKIEFGNSLTMHSYERNASMSE